MSCCAVCGGKSLHLWLEVAVADDGLQVESINKLGECWSGFACVLEIQAVVSSLCHTARVALLQESGE